MKNDMLAEISAECQRVALSSLTPQQEPAVICRSCYAIQGNFLSSSFNRLIL